jgi:hypothetical protein
MATLATHTVEACVLEREHWAANGTALQTALNNVLKRANKPNEPDLARIGHDILLLASDCPWSALGMVGDSEVDVDSNTASQSCP